MNKPVDNKEYLEYLKTDQWKRIAARRLEIDENTCQACGSVGTRDNPLEVHHLTYRSLYHEQDRIYEDLVTLCSSCHKLLHRSMNRVTSPTGRRGWSDNKMIPKVSCYRIAPDRIDKKTLDDQGV